MNRFFRRVSHTLFSIILAAPLYPQELDLENFPYAFEKRNKVTGLVNRSVVFSDIDNDGRDELLYLTRVESGDPSSYLLYREDDLTTLLWSINFWNGVLNISAHNFDRTGDQEIFVSERKDNSCYLSVYRSDRELMGRYKIIEGKDTNQSGEWDGTIDIASFTDLNNDGYEDAILRVSTAHDLYPRGVLAFDIFNEKRLWFFETGTLVRTVIIKDLNNDGNAEILLATHAPSNGSSANGTDDNHSYLILLDQSGERLWQKSMGGVFSRCSIKTADLDNDDTFEVISAVSSEFTESEYRNRVSVWSYMEDPISLELKKETFFDNPIRTTHVSDISGDNKPEIIVTTESGGVFVFDDAFQIKKRFLEGRSVYISMIDDILGTGTKQAIASVEGSGLFLFNSQFKPLALYPKGITLETIRVGFHGKNRLILTDPDGKYEVQFRKNIKYFKLPILNISIGFMSGVILVLIVTFLVKAFQNPVSSQKLPFNFLNDISNGIILLDRKGSILYTNSQIARIFHLPDSLITNMTMKEIPQLEAVSNIVDQSVNGRTRSLRQQLELTVNGETRHVSIAATAFRQSVFHPKLSMVIVEDLTEKVNSYSAIVWTSVAQNLAHSIRNPLDILGKQIKRLQRTYHKDGVTKAQTYDRITGSLLEEITRLEKTTRLFMRFSTLPRNQASPVDCCSVLRNLEQNYRQNLSQNYRIDLVRPEDGCFVRGDEDQLYQAFENIVENALSAMSEGGLLKIDINIMEKMPLDEPRIKKYACITFSDEGQGIQEEDLQKIFDAGFTRKSSGLGFGLCITKQIVEAHNGSISVHSKVNAGTTVEVIIPTYYEDSKF